MPCTPMADRASRTSSSLNGLMIAVTSFMELLPPSKLGLSGFERLELVQALQRERHQALAPAERSPEFRKHCVGSCIPAHFGAHFEVVGGEVRTCDSSLLVLRAGSRRRGKAEVEAVLIVEGFVPQNA